ncbi:MAG: hypothetical protein NVS3B16_25360 [Vulcanimicrobiaceae bacterium]
MKVSVLKFTLAMRDAMRAVEILNHRARRRHDAKRFKARLRTFEKFVARNAAPFAVKRNRGPRISDRRRLLDDVNIYRSDDAFDWVSA